MPIFRPGDPVRWQQGSRWFEGTLTRPRPDEWPESDWAIRVTDLGSTYAADDDIDLIGQEVAADERHLTLRHSPVTARAAAALVAFTVILGVLGVIAFHLAADYLGWLFVGITVMSGGYTASELHYRARRNKKNS